MTLVDTSVVTTLDHGTFALAGDAGQVLDTLPLTASLDGQRLPLQQQVSADGRTLTLTPDLTGIGRNALQPIASPLENQLAMNDLINAVSIGTSLGSLVGTAIGSVAGLGIGFVLAGASCVAISLGCVVAVLPIMALTPVPAASPAWSSAAAPPPSAPPSNTSPPPTEAASTPTKPAASPAAPPPPTRRSRAGAAT